MEPDVHLHEVRYDVIRENDAILLQVNEGTITVAHSMSLETAREVAELILRTLAND